MCKAVFADTQTQPSISFSIKPGLCVLNNAETECRDQLRVHWKSNRDYSLCLYQQAEEELIYCWKLAREGEYQFPFVASETTIFELRDTKSQKILIAKTFKILKDQNSRHRRRNPWSFF